MKNKVVTLLSFAAVPAVGLLFVACSEETPVGTSVLEMAAPCQISLTPINGDRPLDEQVSRIQDRIQATPERIELWEQLGWLYVSKARSTNDPGYYKLSEQVADCMDLQTPNSPSTLLLRGHILQNLHHFREAEVLARQLVSVRGLSFDHGLLGDTLIDQGNVQDAARAYQQMMDLKPDSQAYSRAAHVRWITGDVNGAIRLMKMATSATSRRASEPAAWAYSRLAFYQFHNRQFSQALENCERALLHQLDYAPALLLQGRVFLADEETRKAVASLARATALNPAPEYQWALAEALYGAGNEEQARKAEEQLRRHGEVEDPRILSLFLATRGEETGRSLRLARQEIRVKQDIFSLDALAWALRAAGHYQGRTALGTALGTDLYTPFLRFECV